MRTRTRRAATDPPRCFQLRRVTLARMATPRPPLARTALLANGMVWFGLSAMLFTIAAEQSYAAFSGQWFNIVGWSMLVAVAAGLTVTGVIENRNIRAGKRSTRPPR